MTRVSMAVVMLVLAIAVAACGTSPGDGSPPTGDAGAAWRTQPLTDVRTGESFRIDDLRGRLVALEPMAVWCSTCRVQQGEVSVALERLGDAGMIFVSIGVDPNEQPTALAEYAEQWGFDWRFVVASQEVARSLADEFGAQVLSPPSTPMILVDPDGVVVHQSFGIKGSDALVALFSDHLP